jgi:tetraacyldisaccharide 4'-kinase
MREPAFWYRPPSLMSRLLSPFGAIYGAATACRMSLAGRDAGIPVICIGNYHVGGAGKTPATIKLSELLRASGETPFVVSRGYGGRLHGPVRVQPETHTAADVGDEPLMMSSRLPVVVSRDRAAGAALAKSEGASVILLDDGFQNPSLKKDLSVVVIDATRGVGNGQVFPAGPLRAPLKAQIARTDALIVVGEGSGANGLVEKLTKHGVPVLSARLKADPKSVSALRDQRVLAFAGIGDPGRFFSTLRANGVNVAKENPFADHHVFSLSEIEHLRAHAAAKSLKLVTTEKDMARIRSDARLARYTNEIATLDVTLEFDDEEKLRSLAMESLAGPRNKTFKNQG